LNRPGHSNEEDSHEILDQFVAAGGNFIDTADVYQMGLSETIIGTWLAKHPELRKKLIIATKLFVTMDRNDPNSVGLSRHHIFQAVENSLERLQTSYIDLYQVIDMSCNVQLIPTPSSPPLQRVEGQGWSQRNFNGRARPVLYMRTHTPTYTHTYTYTHKKTSKHTFMLDSKRCIHTAYN